MWNQLHGEGTISCQELFPTDEAGGSSDHFVDSLGPDSDGLIDGEGKCWEAQEGNPSNQILDVQGRLKSNIAFWRETLGAPAYVLDWGTNCLCVTYWMPSVWGTTTQH